MATVFFRGDAALRTQVGTFQITAVDGTPANTTYKITIGNETVSVVGDTDVNTTATNLQVALDDSTHPYFTAVTWTVATDTVTATASVSGAPFVAASSVTGGTGTIGAYSATTANGGPSDMADVRNFSTGALPAANEILIFKDISTNACWNMADSWGSIDLSGLQIWDTYTGNVGLDWTRFATSADGATYDTTGVTEYRGTEMWANVTQANGPIEIGKRAGPVKGAGSTRIVLNTGTVAADIVIESTASTSAEPGRPVIRLRCNNGTTDVFVKDAPGGLGIAIEDPGFLAALNQLSVAGVNSKVFVGESANLTAVEQTAGLINISGQFLSAETIATVKLAGGTLRTGGLMAITAFTNNGGRAYLNHNPRTGVAVTTANLNHGTTDATGTTQPRTWTTVNLDIDNAKIIYDDADLTITNANFVQADTAGRL